MIEPDRIIRSRRRSISVEVQRGGGVVVRAPYGVPEEAIRRFVASKQEWLSSHIEQRKNESSAAERVRIGDGGRIPFLGKLIRLQYHDARTISLRDFDAAQIERERAADYAEIGATLYLPSPRMRREEISLIAQEIDAQTERRQNARLLTDWYRRQAGSVLRQRTQYYAEEMGLAVRSVRISSAQRRWGSCNSRQGINYSWRVVLLGFYEIDCVVVHELSHIRHRGHGSDFYAEMERYLPDRRERDKAIDRAGWVMEVLSDEERATAP